MEQEATKINYETIRGYLQELQNKIPEKETETLRKMNYLTQILDEYKDGNTATIENMNNEEVAKTKEVLRYISAHYDGTEESIKRIKKRLESPERRYDELISSIRILARKETEENTKKLEMIVMYLQAVKDQRHLPQVTEIDRPEMKRFKEILGDIDKRYDGTNESVKQICDDIEKREDMEEVLRHQMKEKKEIER